MKRTLNIVFLFCSPFIFGQNANSWEKKADFGGFKREQAVAFTVLDKGYISTGVDTAENVLNDLWEYDPTLDSWTQGADIPATGRRNAFAFSINNKGYVGTGISSNESTQGTKLIDFWEYNPVTNMWAQKANYPGSNGGGIYYATGFAINGKGYVCGGKNGPSNYSKELWEYKPQTDQWTKRVDFPGGIRYNMSSLTIGNKGYVGLGTDQDNYRNDWWEYNPGNNQWTLKTHFPGGQRASASSFTLNNKGYICLGTNGGLKGDLYLFDPNLNAWYPRADYGGSERKNAVAFAVNNRAFVGTGKGVSSKKGSMYEYIPDYLLGMETPELEYSVYPNPATETVILKTSENISQIHLISALGIRVLSIAEPIEINTLDVSNLPSGTYSIEVISGQTSTSKSIQIIH